MIGRGGTVIELGGTGVATASDLVEEVLLVKGVEVLLLVTGCIGVSVRVLQHVLHIR